MYVMKFYDELHSSGLEQYEIPAGAWMPVYLKEPGPPLMAVLCLRGVEIFSTEYILWARPGDFVEKYIEHHDREEQLRLIVFVDNRQYFFSYMTPPGKYLFGNTEINLIIFGEEMIIGRHRSTHTLSLAIKDFAELGILGVHLRLDQDRYV